MQLEVMSLNYQIKELKKAETNDDKAVPEWVLKKEEF